MVVRKCDENEKDALRWCVAKPDKRKSRKMTNKLFSAMMYEMMGWNTDCRYKILGHKISYEEETIYIFDLTETEIFMDIKRKNNESQANDNAAATAPVADTDTLSGIQGEGQNLENSTLKKPSRKPFYPSDWKNSFGLPVEEHKKTLEIKVLDDYVKFSPQAK
jgi:hypothetical protein